MIPLAERQCPLCGTQAHSRLFAEANVDERRIDRLSFSSRKKPEFMHYRLLECRRCDLLYASPAPQPDAVADLYREAEFASGIESRYAATTYARLLAPLLPRLPDRAAALDVGAGDGAFLERLLAAGFERVAGVEPSAAPLSHARREVRDLVVEAPFEPGVVAGQFTLVTCFQTLEHVPDPARTLELAHDLVAPGGALLVVVHDRRALSARLLGLRSPIFDVEHLQLFSPRSLTVALTAPGFVDVRVGGLRNAYSLAYWLRLAPLPGPLQRAAGALPDRLASMTISLRAGNLVGVAFKPPAQDDGGRQPPRSPR